MSDYPRAGSDPPPGPPFFLDRIVSYAWLTYVAVGFVLTLFYLQRDFARVQDMGSLAPLAYLGRRWSAHVHYLMAIGLAIWVSLGLRRGRRWAIPLMALVQLDDLVTYCRSAYVYGLVGSGTLSAYAVLRFLGWLGSKTDDRFALREG